LNEFYYSESSTRSNAPFAADGAAAIGVEGVTTAGAARSGRLSFVIAPESVGLGNELARDALASRSQASFFYAIILDVAPALREHQHHAEDAPELEAKAVVVDQGHHHGFSGLVPNLCLAGSLATQKLLLLLARYVFSQVRRCVLSKRCLISVVRY